jgi:hypothetical protein
LKQVDIEKVDWADGLSEKINFILSHFVNNISSVAYLEAELSDEDVLKMASDIHGTLVGFGTTLDLHVNDGFLFILDHNSRKYVSISVRRSLHDSSRTAWIYSQHPELTVKALVLLLSFQNSV